MAFVVQTRGSLPPDSRTTLPPVATRVSLLLRLERVGRGARHAGGRRRGADRARARRLNRGTRPSSATSSAVTSGWRRPRGDFAAVAEGEGVFRQRPATVTSPSRAWR